MLYIILSKSRLPRALDNRSPSAWWRSWLFFTTFGTFTTFRLGTFSFIHRKSDTIKKGIIFYSIFEPFFDRIFTGQTTGIEKIPNFRRIWMGSRLYISLCAAFFGRGMRLYIQDIKPLKWLYMASELKAWKMPLKIGAKAWKNRGKAPRPSLIYMFCLFCCPCLYYKALSILFCRFYSAYNGPGP